jgi:hypothetical protein
MKFVRLAAALTAAMLVTGAAWAAGGIDAPRAIMKQIVANYVRQNKTQQTHSPCDEFCDPAFRKLIGDVGKLDTTDDDMPYDYDVFCQCQDIGENFVIVSDRLVNPARYEAKIKGSDGANTKPWTYVFENMGSKWKITDVIDETGSVRAGMMKALKKKH